MNVPVFLPAFHRAQIEIAPGAFHEAVKQTNMRGKKKKTKKRFNVDDLKPARDAKGGMRQGPARDLKWILKHLQMAQGPGGGGITHKSKPDTGGTGSR
jgi:hypothetical protein